MSKTALNIYKCVKVKCQTFSAKIRLFSNHFPTCKANTAIILVIHILITP